MQLTSEDRLLLHRRNALLRAWRDHGLPVTQAKDLEGLPVGQWFLNTAKTQLLLQLGCDICGWNAMVTARECTLFRLFQKECEAVGHLQHGGCSHLRPLADPDVPEKVLALQELVLLEG